MLEGHEKGVSTITWQPALVEGVPELLATYVSCPFFFILSDRCANSSSFDGTARLWVARTGRSWAVFRDNKRAVYAISFRPDGRFLATGSGDGFMHIYNVKVWDTASDVNCTHFCAVKKARMVLVRWSCQAGHLRDRVAGAG